jgi:hypothetical protein
MTLNCVVREQPLDKEQHAVTGQTMKVSAASVIATEKPDEIED